MMGEFGDLYQQLILDHNARPRHFGPLPGHTHEALGNNPLCGDALVVRLEIRGDTIEHVRFEGQGCAISKASASLMTDFLTGKTLAFAEATFGQFHELVTTRAGREIKVDTESLGKLAALGGVRDFPMRVKCATLAWHTLRAAIAKTGKPASTEEPS